MTDIKTTPATDEEVHRFKDAHVRHDHGRITAPTCMVCLILARIAADAETIKVKDEEIERLRKVRTGSAVERLHNLCDGFDEMDKAQEAELATLRDQVRVLRAALFEANLRAAAMEPKG